MIDPRPAWITTDSDTQLRCMIALRRRMLADGFNPNIVRQLTPHGCAALMVVLAGLAEINDLPPKLQRYVLQVAFAAKLLGLS